SAAAASSTPRITAPESWSRRSSAATGGGTTRGRAGPGSGRAPSGRSYHVRVRRQPTRVVCPQGHTFDADVYRSANVTKAPELRDEILEGRFNRTVCPICQAESYADVPF